ncbi:universal stress protein [Maribacter sp. CXY002]|uniref:universal stress protein n=1 Tax=Maribacter luteocoastalis TaxID=3407671 RepID=UPI003B685FF6
MKTILIPTDFSKNSWNALSYAVKIFKNISCNFYVLHVGDLADSVVQNSPFNFHNKNLDISIQEKFLKLFAKIEKITPNNGHQFIAVQEYGNMTNVIRNFVDDKKIDLIVMGTKGANGLKETVLGSNTGDVITKVPCNLMIIPENATFYLPEKIAFPTDYNIFYSHEILEAITEILQITSANFGVINIVNLKTKDNIVQQKNKSYLQEYLKELFPTSHSFQSLKNKNVKTAIEKFVKCEDIDMLVMVAKNLNFLQYLLFDTTIEKLSFHTTVPILVLHE